MAVKDQARDLIGLVGDDGFVEETTDWNVGESQPRRDPLLFGVSGEPGQMVAGAVRAGAGEKRAQIVEHVTMVAHACSVGHDDLAGSGSVHVAEVTAGVEPISHSLLEDLGIREAPILLAVPQEISVVRDLKDASRAWKQCNLTEVGPKGGQQLLRHPSRAQEPLALRAVGDCAWLARSGHRLRISGPSRIKATGAP